MLAAVLT